MITTRVGLYQFCTPSFIVGTLAYEKKIGLRRQWTIRSDRRPPARQTYFSCDC